MHGQPLMPANACQPKYYKCAVCDEQTWKDRKRGHTYPRWLTYTDPSSGWFEDSVICADCLFAHWRSMEISFDQQERYAWEDPPAHVDWKMRLFDQLILKYVRRTGVELDRKGFYLGKTLRGDDETGDD